MSATGSLYPCVRHGLWMTVVWPLRVLGFALYLVLGCIFGFDSLEEM